MAAEAKKIVWDKSGEKLYETGIDRGVWYDINSSGEYVDGEGWNGLTSVNENPSGGDANDIYADNGKYLSLTSAENYGATIGCYTYPDGFRKSNGELEAATGLYIGQQTRKTFGFSYRTLIGNDIDGEDHGYVIHLVYGAKASPSSANHQTTNENPDAIELSYEINTTPIEVEGFKKTAHFKVDSTKADPDCLAALETILYGKDPTTVGGSDGVKPRMPLPDELIDILTPNP